MRALALRRSATRSTVLLPAPSAPAVPAVPAPVSPAPAPRPDSSPVAFVSAPLLCLSKKRGGGRFKNNKNKFGQRIIKKVSVKSCALQCQKDLKPNRDTSDGDMISFQQDPMQGIGPPTQRCCRRQW